MSPRRLPIGAEVSPEGGVHFRVWAPKRRRVEVVFDPTGDAVALGGEGNGYFSATAPRARAGDLYRYRLDGGEAYPDPASRFQPDGPHGPSQVVDPRRYEWRHAGWVGLPLRGQVLYEMHVGTFTGEGTFASASRELPALAELGVTVVELMPVADFAGGFGWGYDGVNPFAPTRLYGTPDDLRRLVDEAHGLGLAVLLDVVYNHFGPDGNYLGQFSDAYFTSRYATDWGAAINYDGEDSGPVREYVVSNAGHWVDEYRLDGLRLDATDMVFDASADHVLAAVTRRVREAGAGRRTIVVAENEAQHTKLVRPVEEGGYGMDGVWNDDMHHSALVAVTGRREAYYLDYRGSAQELVSVAKHGYLYQGQRYRWQRKRRGTPTAGLDGSVFVSYLENHDQVANSALGQPLSRLASPGRVRALTAYLLLGPGTPLLFQGQELGSSRPFHFFADHPHLADAIRKGRREFMSQFRSVATPEMEGRLPDPVARSTFEACVLEPRDRERHREAYALHGDLLRLRREDRGLTPADGRGLDGAVLDDEAFVLRYFVPGNDRLLLFNLGSELTLEIAPEPLLAPPAGQVWSVLWSSEDPCYGGMGTPPPETEEGWTLPPESALVLAPAAHEKGRRLEGEARRTGPKERRTHGRGAS